jgi:hypothetical protein
MNGRKPRVDRMGDLRVQSGRAWKKMMSRAATGLVAIITLATSGCAPQAFPPKDEIVRTLSALMLTPGLTCEQLRDSFHLDGLQPVQTPAELGLKYEEHWVLSGEGNVIHVWRLPASLNRGTVVLSIGAAGDMACYLFPARLLVNNGWNVILYEYAGFGLSGGVPNLNSLASDLEAVVDYTRALGSLPRVTLMSVSIGSIPSVAVAVRRPDAVNAVILDSPVALGPTLARYGGFLLGARVVEVAAALDEELFSEVIISAMHQPLLVFSGQADGLTPPDAVDEIFQRAAGPKQIVAFPGLDHALGPYIDTALYTFVADTFLAGVWLHE